MLRGSLDHRRDRAGGGQWAFLGRSSGIRVGADEPCTVDNEPDGLGDRLEGVSTGLSEDDIVRVGVGENEPGLMQSRRQPCLTNDVEAGTGMLVSQEMRGRERRGPDVVLRHRQTRSLHPGSQVPRSEDGIVGQDQESLRGVDPSIDEIAGARHLMVLVDEHAVHVGQPALDVCRISHEAKTIGGGLAQEGCGAKRTSVQTGAMGATRCPPHGNHQIRCEPVPPLGLEPRTRGLKVRCSNQLSYGGSPSVATRPCRCEVAEEPAAVQGLSNMPSTRPDDAYSQASTTTSELAENP